MQINEYHRKSMKILEKQWESTKINEDKQASTKIGHLYASQILKFERQSILIHAHFRQIGVAGLARKGLSIRALIAAGTMPFSPVLADAAFPAMPSARALLELVSAKRPKDVTVRIVRSISKKAVNDLLIRHIGKKATKRLVSTPVGNHPFNVEVS